MLVVLDAGVFVSAAITAGGVASRIVGAGIEGRFDYLLCPKLVGELTDVLERPKILRLVNEEDSQRFLEHALAAGRDVADPAKIVSISRDPDDDYLLALADEHQAEWVVTGDAGPMSHFPIGSMGLRSAYHVDRSIGQGVGEEPTLWHSGGGAYMVYHVFTPAAWPILRVSVGGEDPWRDRSDHALSSLRWMPGKWLWRSPEVVRRLLS